MRVILVSHDSSMRHDTGVGHPERPARIPAVIEGVRTSGQEVIDLSPPEASVATLTVVHDASYVAAIERFCAAGGGSLDPDTVAKAQSWEAALRSAGSGPAAVEALQRGDGDLAFLAMRPPGHHAMPARAMGFCLFNNIAITARMLTQQGHKVAIVDWDVHHGNSTQEVFFADPDVLYLSMHEFPAYPGTGWLHECGTDDGEGTTLNIPWPTATGGAAYRWAFDDLFTPILHQFAPDWLLVSAGYDAHVNDPLAGIRLVADDYRFMAGRLAGVVPNARTVVFLEGGYDLAALRESTAATLRGFAGEEGDPASPFPERPSAAEIGRAVTLEAQRYWDL
jgi:acetoin utilization deacetylase AcuC-like enzyme